jgi:ribonuclease-3
VTTDPESRSGLAGYTFKNTELFEQALTHRSAGRFNNERLEFLGDSILGFVITETLYHRYPDAAEGVLTRLRANLVRRETLAALARKLELGPLIRLGAGERKSGGWRRDSILANTLESIIGAIYLDDGPQACSRFILALFDDHLSQLDTTRTGKDPKTVLQEWLQSRKLPLPVYQVIQEQGEAHRRVFTVTCEVTGLDSTVTAHGSSKRSAEQAAASLVLKHIGPSHDAA